MSKLIKVLMMEDDEITSFLNRTIIESTQLVETLVVVENGQEGLDYLLALTPQDQYPDIIFLDINMPILDGFGFLKELHDNAGASLACTKIIALSTSSHPEDLSQLKDFGVTTCLEKPLTETSLRRVLAGISPSAFEMAQS